MGASLGGYIRRHWRGENSLAYAFWINFLIAVLLAHTILERFSFLGPGLLYHNLAILLAITLFPFLLVWSSVGVWRSARASIMAARAAEPPHSTWWGYAARIAAIVISILAFRDLLAR